jgi:hypothetical protein
MDFISRKFHAALDYFSVLVLLSAPWLLNFSESLTATAVAVFAGVLILIMSMMTNYEGGLIRSIPMAIHLKMDVVLGAVLAASPWMFNFNDVVYLPHLIMGLLAIFAGIFSTKVSLTKRMAG